MNKYKYSFDLGAFFGSEEKETKLKAAPEVETSILPRPKQKQEAVQESEPAYDPYGFIPDFAAAYEGAGGVPSVGSDLPLPAGEEQSRYASAVESLLNEMQGSLTPQPDLTAATPVDTPDMAASVESAVAEAMNTSEPTPEVQPTEEATTATTEGGTTGGLMSPRLDSKGSEVTKYDTMLFKTGREQVKGVQGVLTQLGYVPRGIDGSMGRGTRSALREYQSANGLTVTGEADESTLKSLQNASKKRFTFSDATNGLHTNYVEDGIEGAGHHLGGADYRRVGITLEAGIVPDSGLKYKHNGNIITLPNDRSKRWGVLSKAGVTRSNFNEDNVIMDDVVKEGVKRSDYRSDEEFTKAVLTAFQDKAKDKITDLGYTVSDFDADAMRTLGDLAWNAGTDPMGYSSMTPVLEELAKPIAQRDTTRMQGLLNTAPTSGGKILGGVMKRRAIQYNWSVPEDKKVTRVESSAATGTGTYHFADGTTKVISRTKGADTQNVAVPEL